MKYWDLQHDGRPTSRECFRNRCLFLDVKSVRTVDVKTRCMKAAVTRCRRKIETRPWA